MILKKSISLILKIARIFISTNDNTIVYHSFPDVSDNSFALFIYIINHYPEFNNIWLIDHVNKKQDYYKTISNYTSCSNFSLVKKNSLKGVWVFLKSKYIIHTHGLFNKLSLSNKQVNINLWHGMPLKNIGHLDNNKIVPKSHYLIATSKIFKNIMSQAFNIQNNNVFVTGQPRNDFMFENKYSLCHLLGINEDLFKKTILWMPTYRKSVIGDVRNDGKIDKAKDFFSNNNLNLLNNHLINIETVCFVKLHPMDYMSVNDFQKYSNIYFINESHFTGNGVTLYSVLGSIDLMLTDFSSIYIDFLLLDKPIGFVFSDFHEYFNSRGFVFENPKEYMPGKVISTIEELIIFLNELFLYKKDNFSEKRKIVKDKFHDITSNFSEKVFNNLVETNA